MLLEARKEGKCNMFQNGDLIIYGTRGVCRVTAVGTLIIPGVPKDRVYYTLEPYYTGGMIYVPVESAGNVMRPIMSREEVRALLSCIPEIEELWVPDEKQREHMYKESIRRCDNRKLIQIIKTIYRRNQHRMSEGKKVTTTDTKYFKLAEENLYGELAVSFDMEKENVKNLVVERLKMADCTD